MSCGDQSWGDSELRRGDVAEIVSCGVLVEANAKRVVLAANCHPGPDNYDVGDLMTVPGSFRPRITLLSRITIKRPLRRRKGE